MTNASRRKTAGLLMLATAQNWERQRLCASWAVLESNDEEAQSVRERRYRDMYPCPNYRESPWMKMLPDESLGDPESRSAIFFRRRLRFLSVLCTARRRGKAAGLAWKWRG
ncbi:unnamed protein product [Discosporangium mesarthrocarpum]